MRQSFVFLFLLLCSCDLGTFSSSSTAPEAPKRNSLTIMAFNVENLFDAQHDLAKYDDTYLPLIKKQNKNHKDRCAQQSTEDQRKACLEWDWNDAVVAEKLKRLTEVLKQVNNGLGPDVVLLQEVENRLILDLWLKKYLNGMGYTKSIIVEGQDLRGMDVAILSKLPMEGSPQLHPIPFRKISDRVRQDTRGILQANFVLPNGPVMTVFSVDLPSAIYPAELREQGLKFLNDLLKGLPKNRLAIAGGDFSITMSENQEKKWLEKWAPNWIVADSSKIPDSFQDMIWLSKNFNEKSNWKFQPESARHINTAPHQLNADGKPQGFTLPGPLGVSTHLPFVIELYSAQQ